MQYNTGNLKNYNTIIIDSIFVRENPPGKFESREEERWPAISIRVNTAAN
jgi:hypothetical protein